MHKVRNALKNRALLTLLAIVMVWGSFTFMLVPEANACPTYTVEILYYTDASLTQVCGQKYTPCYCPYTAQSGCVTSYTTRKTWPCE
jgi:hypothetical protein